MRARSEILSALSAGRHTSASCSGVMRRASGKLAGMGPTRSTVVSYRVARLVSFTELSVAFLTGVA